MVAMRMMPISVAQSSEYHGPRKTEQTMLMKCAMGHIPSTRRMGEITTPSAMSMESTVNFSSLLEFFTCTASFQI